ncbi:ribonuclease P protein component [Pseudomonadales bacterium]|nr:ribonuclease P protein component [Pseudomonadales bacterium]
MNTIDPNRRFQKDQRLLNAHQYKNVFDNVDCKQSGKYFTFLSTSSQQAKHRLGLIVAKKHIPLAVNRNKIKRAIRESFRQNLNHEIVNTQITSFDVIVLAKSSVAQLDNAQLNEELRKQWLRLIAKRQQI